MATRVAFLRHHLSYNSGEIAAFPEAEAAGYIAKGIAVETPPLREAFEVDLQRAKLAAADAAEEEKRAAFRLASLDQLEADEAKAAQDQVKAEVPPIALRELALDATPSK